MASIKMYAKTGDVKAQEIQSGIEKKFGKIPEVFQAMGRSGDFMDAVMKVADAAGNNLDPKTKELIIIAVSAVNGCTYCLDAHRSAALMMGVPEEEISGAVEVASAISLFNTFNKAIDLKSDLKTPVKN
ncbi:MAG: carboxymuconolactone decarboxylase family protein [Lentisphaerae bacterium]|nr:carboxymuconolactone decarboxylase family protein [Lentisphaerota bacterium]